jgi:hypothetical protein
MENKQVTGKELKAAYQRKWRAEHPKAAREQQDRYWQKKADAINKTNEKAASVERV